MSDKIGSFRHFLAIDTKETVIQDQRGPAQRITGILQGHINVCAAMIGTYFDTAMEKSSVWSVDSLIPTRSTDEPEEFAKMHESVITKNFWTNMHHGEVEEIARGIAKTLAAEFAYYAHNQDEIIFFNWGALRSEGEYGRYRVRVETPVCGQYDESNFNADMGYQFTMSFRMAYYGVANG